MRTPSESLNLRGEAGRLRRYFLEACESLYILRVFSDDYFLPIFKKSKS